MSSSERKEDSPLKKCEKTANSFRLQGNTHYQERNFTEALKYYNQAILVAPHGSDFTELALGFANRSAIFYQMNDWEGSIRDIQQAIRHLYPLRNQYKLYRRKAQCMVQLKKYKEACSALELARNQIEAGHALLQKEEKDSVVSDLDRIFKDLDLKHQLSSGVKTDYRVMSAKYDFEESDDIMGVSKKVALKYNTRRGRHLVAKVKIPAGRIVIKEKPYVSILLPAYHATHCHKCFKETNSPIPCRTCTKVFYCSENCRQKGIVYHWAECPHWNLFQKLGTFAHLSFRILMVSGLSIIKKQLKGDNDVAGNSIPGCSSDGQYERKYTAIWNLMTNESMHSAAELKKIRKSSSDIIEASIDHLMGDSTWEELQAQKAFQSRSPETKDLAVKLPKVIYHHWLQFYCNAQAITTVEPSSVGSDVAGHNVVDVEQKRLATALFPATCLLNHSCKPNVIVSFKDGEIFIRTTRTIAVGEELLHCYGPHYQHMKKATRQEVLKNQYNFDCLCEACICEEEGGKVPKHLENVLDALVENEEKTVLEKAKEDLIESMDLFRKAREMLDDDNKANECLKLLLRCCEIQSRHLYKHHKSLSRTQDCIAKCYTMLGDYPSACKYLKLSISTVEKRFGMESIELTSELLKLAEIQFNMQDIKGCMITTNRCLPLLIRYYGDSHESAKQLRKMKDTVENLVSGM